MRAVCLLLILGSTLSLASCSLDGTPHPTDQWGPDGSSEHDAAHGDDAGGNGPGTPHGDGGPAHDAGHGGDGDAGAQPTRFESRRLSDAPSYTGSVNNSSTCSQSYVTQGFEPVPVAGGPERYPLFLYFVGTAFTTPDPSASYDSMAATKVIEAMARRGFVALSADYDHGLLAWLSDHKGQLDCLFGSSQTESLIAKACALPHVDCAQGIATWGHSMGGYVAVMAHNFEPRVRAAWATGYGGDATATLAKSRLRVVNGEADTGNGTQATVNTITGLSAADCPDPDTCLRTDGSGWVIVRVSDLALPQSSSADHCWFDKRSCSDSAITLEPSWIDPNSDKPYALESNADWVSATARRP